MRFSPTVPKAYLALLVAIYVLLLVATAPATLVAKVLSAQPGIALEHLSGSVWHGAVDQISIPSTVGTVQIQNLQWDMQWRYLLRGELALKIAMADVVGSLTVARGFSGLRVAQADLALPADELGQFLPQLGIGQPGGEVQFQTQGFALTEGTSNEASVVWRNATLNLSPVQPLGDYRLQLLSEGGKINARLETQAGKLRLDGNGAWSRQDGLSFKGSARAAPGYATQLQALLVLCGQDRGDGVHVFNLQVR